MRKQIYCFAIMACLASSLAFAGDKAKPARSVDDAKAEATQTAAPDNIQQNGSRPCASAKDDKKSKHNTKPAPSDQEREFDRVLMGIYG